MRAKESKNVVWGEILMRKSRMSFKRGYLIYLGVLGIFAAAALIYVLVLLRQYEKSQPEQQVWKAVDELSAQAADGSFSSLYELPEAEPGAFEEGRDIRKEYLALYSRRDDMTLTKSGSSIKGDTLEYQVECGGAVIAKVGLKAEGSPVTKLAVFSMQDWAVDYVRPEMKARDYTLTVPETFTVTLNGTPLEGKPEKDRLRTYTASGLYLPPDFSITDGTGDSADYSIRNGRVLAEYYDYNLTLPSSLTVQVNGETWKGKSEGEDKVRYEITVLEQPSVIISDYYGNTVEYDGEDKLPLTDCFITADQRYTVEVDGAPVPKQAVTRTENPDYRHFAEYAENLPQVCTYSVAVLKEDAEITVADGQGKPVKLEKGSGPYKFLNHGDVLDEVPREVSSQIDVLKVAQDWSLFMSNDMAFSRIKSYLIPSSYQYEAARKYASGADITYTSEHTLANPAFTGNKVGNFCRITDNCFSVDISFVKHMRLPSGTPVDDPMNDRFYFVKYDDPSDSEKEAVWKLVGMEEIIDDRK